MPSGHDHGDEDGPGPTLALATRSALRLSRCGHSCAVQHLKIIYSQYAGGGRDPHILVAPAVGGVFSVGDGRFMTLLVFDGKPWGRSVFQTIWPGLRSEPTFAS